MADSTRGQQYVVARQMAMTAALEKLATIWPAKFAPKVIAASLQTWLDACVGVATDCLEPAAAALAAESKRGVFPPRPGDLAERARRIERDHFQASLPSGTMARPLTEAESSKNSQQIDRLYVQAVYRLREAGHEKFARPISQMWAMLYASQQTDDLRALVRKGEVSESVWLEVVEAWLRGERPRPHPMNNMGIAEGAVA